MNIKLPKVSIITCTYNGERVIEDYFRYLFMQDYPLNKIELIISDGGSIDKTMEIVNSYKKKYPRIIKIIPNKSKIKVGRGRGLDVVSRKASGELMILIDQDNLLFQKNWIKKMVEILLKYKNISGVQSMLQAPRNSSLLDRYLNLIGIEDPFAINYSLNSQISLNPHEFYFNKEEKFYIYEVNKKNFYYAGDNGFVIRKKDFFESGGYTQDIDNFYRMALSKKKYKIAVPKNIRLHHKSSTSLKHLIEKKGYYVKRYLLENYSNREFYWFSFKKNNLSQNLKFIKTVIFYLSFFSQLIEGIKMYLKEKEPAWLIHPVATWLITIFYINFFLSSKISKKQKEAKL